jgi:hypothetical protein
MRFACFAGTQDAERLSGELEEEYRARIPGFPFHLLWPEFHFLRAGPRGHRLRRLAGLPPVSAIPPPGRASIARGFAR